MNRKILLIMKRMPSYLREVNVNKLKVLKVSTIGLLFATLGLGLVSISCAVPFSQKSSSNLMAMQPETTPFDQVNQKRAFKKVATNRFKLKPIAKKLALKRILTKKLG